MKNLNVLPTTQRPVLSLFVGLCLVLSAAKTVAEQPGRYAKNIGDYEVLYSVFSTSFLSPEIASAYGIVRSKARGMVNVAVVPAGGDARTRGRSSLIRGHVSNIIGQRQDLDFMEINEGAAVYYLAPFSFQNEDFMTFKIRVQPDPNKPAHPLSFQRTLYRDQ